MRAAVAILVVGCGSAQAPPREVVGTAPAAPPVTRYCPPHLAAGPWASELFPACPSPEFPPLPICVGPCPKPCRVTTNVSGMHTGGESVARIERDQRGRWVASVSEDHELRCTYRDDKIDRCDKDYVHVERDARGRIAKVVAFGNDYPVTYDALGRVLSFGKRTFQYDERGFLIQDTQTQLSVDGEGHVTSAGGTVYRYDGDRLVGIDTEATNDHGGVTYDDQGRVLNVHQAHLDEIHNSTYDYECP